MFNPSKQHKNFPFIFALLLLMNLYSCDFAYQRHVTGNYYVISVETKDDFGLSYKLSSGDYVGKAPGKLLEYGFNDTFLVAKTQEYKNENPSYYVIDMTKDSELAHEEAFRVGPVSEDEYLRTWKQKFNIQLKEIR
jgi:hypothetical protein